MNTYKIGDFSLRPWGLWKVTEIFDDILKKNLIIMPNCALSLQSHIHRNEEWKILSGNAEIIVDRTKSFLSAGNTIYIPQNITHTIRNIDNHMILVVEEIQTGTILDEKDIIRYEDLYGRCQ